jgi:hypothetical protein
MRFDVETAAGRHHDVGSLKRFVAAGRRLLASEPCDRCAVAAATIANGKGIGYCARCSNLALAERREGFARAAELRRRIDAERARFR